MRSATSPQMRSLQKKQVIDRQQLSLFEAALLDLPERARTVLLLNRKEFERQTDVLAIIDQLTATFSPVGAAMASAANFVIVLVRKRPLDCVAIPQAGLVEQHAGDGPEVVRRHLGFRITKPPECPI